MNIGKFVRVFGILLGTFGVGLLAGSTMEKNRIAEDQRDCRDSAVTTPGPEKDFGYTVTDSTGHRSTVSDPLHLSPEREQRLEMETTAPQGPVPVVYEGDTAMVPGWQWVEIEGYESGSSTDDISSTCGIEAGGIVRAIGTWRHLALVSYRAPSGNTAGTPCNGGEIFFLPSSEFVSFTGRAERIALETRERQRLVKELLAKR